MTREQNQVPPTEPEAKPQSNRTSAFGKYAHLPGSVDDFIRRKQEEIELEEEKFRRCRCNG